MAKKSPTEIIKSLLGCLPAKDLKLASKFLNERRFDSLKELVDSDVYILSKKTKSSDFATQEMIDNLEKIRMLKTEVDEYYSLLYPEEIYEDEDYEVTQDLDYTC